MGDLQRDLRETLEARRGKNPLYSLRAMARDLGISHSYLSLLIVGKRQPSVRRREEIARRLAGERPTEERRRATSENFRPAKPVAFTVLRHWYDLALLDLTSLDDFRPDPEWIARRMKLRPAQARDSLRRLQQLGLLLDEGSGLKKSQRKLSFPTKGPRRAVREFHRQMIAKGLDALDDRAFESRDVTAITFTANPARIAGAKEKIRRFRRSLQRYLSEGSCTELYQLNVQLFPLTNPKGRKR